MRKMKCMFLLILLALLSGAFVACSDDDDSPESKMYTVTLYTAFGENPVTAKVESGKTLGANMTPSKDGYDFKGWFSVDGTDYTKKAIESDVTLFAYFIKTTTEGSGTATVTTTTNEVGADSYESEKKVAVTTNADGTTVTVTTENKFFVVFETFKLCLCFYGSNHFLSRGLMLEPESIYIIKFCATYFLTYAKSTGTRAAVCKIYVKSCVNRVKDVHFFFHKRDSPAKQGFLSIKGVCQLEE